MKTTKITKHLLVCIYIGRVFKPYYHILWVFFALAWDFPSSIHHKVLVKVVPEDVCAIKQLDTVCTELW